MLPHQRFVYPLGQLGLREFIKCPRERRWVRHALPIEHPQMRRRARSTFSRSISAVVVVKPSAALATNALAKGTTIRRWPAHTTPDRGAGLRPGLLNLFFNPHPFQRMDYLLRLRGQRPNLASQFGHQLTLNHSPALHYQTALRRIHVGRRCSFRHLASC